MIVTVTPNPALDETLVVDRLVPGGVHRAPARSVRAGGKGLNVARVLHATGYPVLAVATAGGGTGDLLARDLQAADLPHRLVPVAGATRRSTVVVDRSAGDATVINEVGQPWAVGEDDALVRAVRDSLGAARVLVVSGSLPPRTPEDLVPRLVTAAHDAGALAVVDTSGPALLAAAEAGADALKPNEAELAGVAETDDPLTGARRLCELGAGSVFVSRGERGLLAVVHGDVENVVTARPGAVLRGNPTGAGDAAVAAIAVGLAQGETPEVTLRRAVAWSGAAVLAPLAGELVPGWETLAADVVVVTEPGRPLTAPSEET